MQIYSHLLSESLEDTIDLQAEFDKANKKYFGGKLKHIPVKFSSSKNKKGHVSIEVTKMRNRITNMVAHDLNINKYIHPDHFMTTLLHEMAHLYMIQNFRDFHWRDGYHGREWVEITQRLERESGVPGISNPTSNDETMDYSNLPELKKPFYIVVFTMPGDRTDTFMALSESAWGSFDELFTRVLRRATKYTSYESFDPALAQSMKVSRKLGKSLSAFGMNDRTQSQIDNSELTTKIDDKSKG